MENYKISPAVITAKAGIHYVRNRLRRITAFAGMTEKGDVLFFLSKISL